MQQLQKISVSYPNAAQFYTQNLLEAGISLAEAKKLGADQVNLDNWAFMSEHFQQILGSSQEKNLKLEEAETRIKELERLLAEKDTEKPS